MCSRTCTLSVGFCCQRSKYSHAVPAPYGPFPGRPCGVDQVVPRPIYRKIEKRPTSGLITGTALLYNVGNVLTPTSLLYDGGDSNPDCALVRPAVAVSRHDCKPTLGKRTSGETYYNRLMYACQASTLRILNPVLCVEMCVIPSNYGM